MTKRVRKLSLRKETLLALDRPQLGRVHGGARATANCLLCSKEPSTCSSELLAGTVINPDAPTCHCTEQGCLSGFHSCPCI
jgi:hypothetical protein